MQKAVSEGAAQPISIQGKLAGRTATIEKVSSFRKINSFVREILANRDNLSSKELSCLRNNFRIIGSEYSKGWFNKILNYFTNRSLDRAFALSKEGNIQESLNLIPEKNKGPPPKDELGKTITYMAAETLRGLWMQLKKNTPKEHGKKGKKGSSRTIISRTYL